jgi:hypothetical protein
MRKMTVQEYDEVECIYNTAKPAEHFTYLKQWQW